MSGADVTGADPREAPDLPLRVVVVDDEAAARRRLVRLLSELPGVVVLASCASGREALAAVAARQPDVLFLDIAMPGLDGLAVARQLVEAARPEGTPPFVVFVTAYDEHALAAFRVHAADFVLKPVDPERLREAVDHVRTAVHRARLARAAARAAPDAAESLSPRFVIRDGRTSRFVPVHDILWVQSYGNYARVYTTSGGRYLHRATMAQVAAALGPHGFARIHRTVIVNSVRVVRLRPSGSGQYEALLDGGMRLRVSRTYRDALEAVRTHVAP